MGELLLGCDIGTSSAKVAVIDTAGTLLSTASGEYGLSVRGSSMVEQDPEEILSAVGGAIRRALETGEIRAGDVAGIAFSGQAPGATPVGADGDPLAPLQLYSDRRGEAQAARVQEALGRQRVFALTGNYIDPYYAAVKMLWVLENEPQLYRRARVFLAIKDFVVSRLSGWVGTDYSTAALFGLIFNTGERTWDAPSVSELGLSLDKLPTAVPCETKVAGLNAAGAQLTGLRQGTPVVSGTVDICASMLSVGVHQPGQSAISIGTSCDWAFECSGGMFVPGTIALPSAGRSATQHMIICTLTSAGLLLRWLRESLSAAGAPATYSAFDDLASACPAGARGLLALPHMLGGATPRWRQASQAGLFGLRADHRLGDIVRALMEGVGFALRDNQLWLREHGLPIPPRLGVVGGGARSRPWCQILSDILDAKVHVVPNANEPAAADAVLAGVGTGVFRSVDVLADWLDRSGEEVFSPEPEAVRLYTDLYAIYRQLEELTYPVACDLSALRERSPG